jgi:hypothetical protein
LGHASWSAGLPFFFQNSKTVASSTAVASRVFSALAIPTKYRYVYILSVPLEKTVPITRPLLTKHGSNLESEVAILHDATPFVRAIYDTIDLKFVDIPKSP